MEKESIIVKSQQSMRNSGGGYRINWIDSMKGIAILCVVLGHVLLGYYENSAFSTSILNNIYILKYWIYTWHMPLFVLISGYTFSLSCIRKEAIDIEKTKLSLLNIALLYLIFQVLLCSSKMVFSNFVDNKMNISGLLEMIFLPNNIMWYLWVLIIYYLVFGYLIKNVNMFSGRRWLFVFAILTLINIIEKFTASMVNYRLCTGNLLHCAAYFWLGIGLCKITRIYNDARTRFLLAFSCAYVTLYIFALAVFNDFALREGLLYIVLGELNAICMFILLFSIFQYVKYETISKIGRNSLIVYLLHTYIVTAFKVFFIRIGLCTDKNVIIVICVSWFVPCLVLYFCSDLINGCRFTRKIFKPILFFEK